MESGKIVFEPVEHTRTSECCAECEHVDKKWCDLPCLKCGEENDYFFFEKIQEQMREATSEEQKSVDDYIKSISKTTGVDFWDLEKEPCEVEVAKLQQAYNKGFEDCRQVVLDIDFHKIIHTTTKPTEMIRKKIEQLHVDLQEPKTGYWIAHSNGIWIEYYECSKCGKIHDTQSNYCEKCGIRMVEPQENKL